MADHPPRAGLPPSDPRTGWPYQPADHGEPAPAGPAVTPWTQPPAGVAPAPAPPPPAPDGPRRWSRILAVAASLLLLGALTLAFVAFRGVEREARRLPGASGPASTAPSGARSPSARSPAGPAGELRLLDGRVVVTAQPGWTTLDSSPDFASVSLALREPTGRPLLSTMSVVTLSSPRSLDTTLKLDRGVQFEVAGVDGPLRVTAQPGTAAHLVAGAVRAKGTFFVNVSIFVADGGGDLDVPTLQAIFTDQLAPALRFP